MKVLRQLYLNNLFFLVFGGIIVLFAVAFSVNLLFKFAVVVLILFLVVLVYDISQLFKTGFHIEANRSTQAVYSLGDENTVELSIENQNSLRLKVTIVDELPFQFQQRDFRITLQLDPFEKRQFEYSLRPLKRGEYEFGKINVFSSSPLGFASRRDVAGMPMKVAVYPSTILMKKFQLYAVQKYTTRMGLRKLRRIGHSYEFDHIKSYVPGDDPRSINWKATGRRAELMVNHYVDEKAQQVYCILDKSRAMQMPFNGLTLLDYAINTSLVISKISLQKHDRAGLLSFSNKIGNIVKAGTGSKQLNKIYSALYNEKESQLEANYELMYNALRRMLGGRSLLFLFTNFESTYAMERVLPMLQQIHRIHLLVVVFFKNTKIARLAETPGNSIEEIYEKTIARKFLTEKELIISELQKHKIQVVFTTPENLHISTINKYLELKARGMI